MTVNRFFINRNFRNTLTKVFFAYGIFASVAADGCSGPDETVHTHQEFKKDFKKMGFTDEEAEDIATKFKYHQIDSEARMYEFFRKLKNNSDKFNEIQDKEKVKAFLKKNNIEENDILFFSKVDKSNDEKSNIRFWANNLEVMKKIADAKF